MPTIRSRNLRLSCAFLAPFALAAIARSQAVTPKAIAPADAEKAAASFDAFASRWMDRMQRAEDDNRMAPQISTDTQAPGTSYRGYTDEFKVELRETGYPGAPFVGLIRYSEELYHCADRGATRCGVRRRTPITEIFRFQNGRWVY